MRIYLKIAGNISYGINGVHLQVIQPFFLLISEVIFTHKLHVNASYAS